MVKNSVFMKTCFECGNKVDFLVESKCEECFKLECPPIKELKPLNIKYCNSCKRLLYSHRYNEGKLLANDIYNLVKRNLVIDEHYVLNELKIVNLDIDFPNVKFEVEVDCDLK